MPTNRLLLPFFLLAFFLSCKKDYSYEGGIYSNKKCLHCPYLPLCDSSQFVYVDSTLAGIDTMRNGILLAGDTTISGLRYARVNGFSTLGQGLLFNCDNNDYRILTPVPDPGINIDSLLRELLQGNPIPLPPGIFQLPAKFSTSILKASKPAGATWTDTIYKMSVTFLANVFAGVDYTLLEKGVQRQVFGKTYNDVFHVKSKVRISITATGITIPPIPSNVVTDYYLAKGVGLIEMNLRENDTLQVNSRLYRYKL
ncbi:MAG: hypothetical protein JWP69_1389 [Flaviaesturariibacter sp.]|nr:hypothetical protein [Flaviaesturariibacter sp.]